MTFRDDPRLVELLERTSVKHVSPGTALEDVVGDDDEYMTESFDGEKFFFASRRACNTHKM